MISTMWRDPLLQWLVYMLLMNLLKPVLLSFTALQGHAILLPAHVTVLAPVPQCLSLIHDLNQHAFQLCMQDTCTLRMCGPLGTANGSQHH